MPLSDTPEALYCQLATSAEALEQVYRLRYRCYRRNGSIDVHPSERFSDDFDRRPNSFSFLIGHGAAEPWATVRIHVVKPVAGWDDSPGRRVFGDHPLFPAIAGASYVEASRLCFGETARRDSFVRLLGNMAALAELHEAEWLIACPRVEHAPVYQNLFGFEMLAEPRPYFGVKFETQLLGIRQTALRECVQHRRPMQRAWSAAREQLASMASLAIAA